MSSYDAKIAERSSNLCWSGPMCHFMCWKKPHCTFSAAKCSVGLFLSAASPFYGGRSVLFLSKKNLNATSQRVFLTLVSVWLSVCPPSCRPRTARSVRTSSASSISGVAARRPLVFPSTDHRRSTFFDAATYLFSLSLSPSCRFFVEVWTLSSFFQSHRLKMWLFYFESTEWRLLVSACVHVCTAHGEFWLLWCSL